MAWLMTYDPKEAEVIIRSELEWLRERIKTNIIMQGANASGKTIDSMKVTTTSDGGELTGRPFFGTLETGRRGGKIPRNFASIIYDWMMAKGVHAIEGGEKADRSLSWAIAKTIQRKGTVLYREGGRDTIYSREITKTIKNLNERMAGLMSKSIQTIHLNLKNNGGQYK